MARKQVGQDLSGIPIIGTVADLDTVDISARWMAVTSTGLGTAIGQATWTSHSGTFLVRQELSLDAQGNLRQRQTLYAESQYLGREGIVTRLRTQTTGVWNAWPATWDIVSYATSDDLNAVYGYADTIYTSVMGKYSGIYAISGTAFTASNSYVGSLVKLTNASPVTVTLPSTTAIETNASMDFVQYGAGAVSFVAGSGVTVNATPSLMLRAQFSVATAIKMGTAEWLLVGDLA